MLRLISAAMRENSLFGRLVDEVALLLNFGEDSNDRRSSALVLLRERIRSTIEWNSLVRSLKDAIL